MNLDICQAIAILIALSLYIITSDIPKKMKAICLHESGLNYRYKKNVAVITNL